MDRKETEGFEKKHLFKIEEKYVSVNDAPRTFIFVNLQCTFLLIRIKKTKKLIQ